MFNDAATAKSSFRRSLFFRRVPNIGQDVHGRRVRNHFVMRNVYFVDFAFDVYDFGGFRGFRGCRFLGRPRNDKCVKYSSHGALFY